MLKKKIGMLWLVRQALERLYEQFRHAPLLGSLIDPEAGLGKGTLVEMKWEEVAPLLTKALKEEGDYCSIF